MNLYKNLNTKIMPIIKLANKNKNKNFQILIIFIFVYAIFIIYKSYHLKNNIHEQESIKITLQNKINFFTQEINKFKYNKQSNSTSSSIIISETNTLPEILKILDEIKKQANIKKDIFKINSIININNKNNKNIKNIKNIKSQNILIDINTSYNFAMYMLKQIKNQKKLITINKIKINAMQNNYKNNQKKYLNLILDITIYKISLNAK